MTFDSFILNNLQLLPVLTIADNSDFIKEVSRKYFRLWWIVFQYFAMSCDEVSIYLSITSIRPNRSFRRNDGGKHAWQRMFPSFWSSLAVRSTTGLNSLGKSHMESPVSTVSRQFLNSPYPTQHGIEPGREKGESKITCKRMDSLRWSSFQNRE